MRLSLLSIAALVLAPLASAQVPCGLPGVTVTATPAVAAPGTPILVTLTNNSGSLIQLPSSCTISSVHAGTSCSGPIVFGPFCLSVITPIPAGQSSSGTWMQNDSSGVQVPNGDYAIEVKYWDANFSVLSSCCVGVTVGTDPGTGYCATGAGGLPCPCGNPGSGGAGCANSTGLGALLVGSGVASVGFDSVVLTASQAPAVTPGLFFSGPGALPGLPFGDGLRCVSGPVRRLGVVTTDAAGTAQTPWTLSVVEGLVPGDLRHYQYWYRDVPGPCSGGFNLSNGYRIQW